MLQLLSYWPWGQQPWGCTQWGEIVSDWKLLFWFHNCFTRYLWNCHTSENEGENWTNFAWKRRCKMLLLKLFQPICIVLYKKFNVEKCNIKKKLNLLFLEAVNLFTLDLQLNNSVCLFNFHPTCVIWTLM